MNSTGAIDAHASRADLELLARDLDACMPRARNFDRYDMSHGVHDA